MPEPDQERQRVHESLTTALALAAELAEMSGRDDLSARLGVATTRARRPATVIAVAGEFKQGKSSLVNALLGRPICPVDDDLTTSALTVIQHAAEARVVVIRRVDDAVQREQITPADLARFVTEAGNPGNELGVEQVAIGLPNELLATGLTLVDTPGVGGLLSGHAAATLAFLPYTDALLFVTDASSELTAPELEFLQQARATGASVVCVLTKKDLYPAYERIAALDAEHLARTGADVEILVTSAYERIAAIRTDDADLEAISGLPVLRAWLEQHALDRTRTSASQRALAEVDESLGLMENELAGLEAMLADDASAAAAEARYREVAERLEHLRGPGAKWGQVLGDRMADLSSSANFQFRGEFRSINQRMDEAIEELASAAAWDELARQLQRDVADAIGTVFRDIEARVGEIALALAEVVATETGEEISATNVGDLAADIEQIWSARLRQIKEDSKSKRVTEGTLGSLRAAQGGLMMMGLLTQFLPAGTAALLMANPLTAVLAAGFAGKQIKEGKARAVAQRRQQARATTRQFLDDVQFELSNRLTDLLRERQRELRDHYAARVTELQRTYTELANEAKATASATSAELEAKRGEAARRRAALDAAKAAAREAVAQIGAQA